MNYENAVFVVSFLAIGALAGLLVRRVPSNRLSWVFVGVGVGFLTIAVAPLFGPTTESVISGTALFAAILPGFGVFVPLWFPTGRPPTGRWRWVGVLGVAGPIMILSGAAAYPIVEGGSALETVDGCNGPGSCLISWGLTTTLVAVAAAVASLVVRWIRSRGVEREQLKWLVIPFALFGIGALAEFGGFQDSVVSSVGLTGGLILTPVAIAIAILRYRLYEIDRIISRTVSYTMIVGVLGALFAGIVAGVGAVVPSQNSLAVAASTLAVAAFFNPLRRRIQGVVDRHFNRARYDAQQIVDAYAASMRDRVDLARAIAEFRAVAMKAVAPQSSRVWLRRAP